MCELLRRQDSAVRADAGRAVVFRQAHGSGVRLDVRFLETLCRVWAFGIGSGSGFKVAVVSTTATKSTGRDFLMKKAAILPVEVGSPALSFEPVCCDWLSFVHEYQTPVEPRESGRVLCLSADGEITWESISWEQIRNPSSDTSIRVKCDGRYLRGTGNIGRFGHCGNVEGLTVLQCVEKWARVLRELGFDTTGFGSRSARKPPVATVDAWEAGATIHRITAVPWVDRDHNVQPVEATPLPRGEAWAAGGALDCGTTLTRVDLAGNFRVSDYAALCHSMSVRKIGRRLPASGKYGPTWGYDGKRGNWWKAKLYDKTAEQEGKRRSDGGATLARFEVQLGGEYLKRERLDRVLAWKGKDMGNVVYGRFASDVFRDSVAVDKWDDIPHRYRVWAYVWRDGGDLRQEMSRSQYFKVKKILSGFGLDVDVPCNVLALTRPVRVVQVESVTALRAA